MGILNWFKMFDKSADQAGSEASTPAARPKIESFSSDMISTRLAQRGIATVESAAETSTKQRTVKAEWSDRMQDPVESLVASECETVANQFASRSEALLKGHLEVARKLKTPDVGSDLKYYVEETRRRWEGDETIGALKDEFRHIYAEYERLKRELREFRSRHNLLRQARASTKGRKVFFWGFFLLLLSVETFTNAHFFEEYNEIGLLGGWIEALFISAVNVLLATFLGIKVVPRALHGPGAMDRLWSISLLAFFVSFIVLFNFGAGHYRTLLGASLPPGVAEQAAFDQLLNAPFELSGLKSLGLVVFGLMAAAFAGWDGYAMYDDPFPMYGKKVRAQSEAEVELHKRYEEIVESGSDVASEVINSIKADMARVVSAQGECSSIRRDVEDLERTALLNESEISRCHEKLTQAYRATVSKLLHVDDRPPQFFSAGIPRLPDLISKLDFSSAKHDLAESENRLESLRTVLNDLERNSKPDLSGEVQRLADIFFTDVAPYYMVVLLKGQKHGSVLSIEWRHLDTFLSLKYELSFEDVARGAVLLRLPRTRLAGKREDVESARVSDDASGLTLEVDTWPPKSDEGNKHFPKALSAGIQGKEVSVPMLLTQNS